MGFLNVVLSEKVKNVNTDKNQLNIELLSGEIRKVDISDLNSVLIESRLLNISTYTLDALAKNKVTVYFCDEKHLPTSIFLPFNSHFAQLRLLKLQNECPKPLQKQMWKCIVKQKINNQMRCMQFVEVDNCDRMQNFENSVLSGDSGNVEASAANLYFKSIMNKGFTRDDECLFNSAINYGYALIRGQIARSVVSSGLQPCLGIHHCNELNNFNLVDDLIEPFRPFVDLFVLKSFFPYNQDFSTSEKKKMLDVMNLAVRINSQNHSMQNAIEKVVDSYVQSLKGCEVSLILPMLDGVENYGFE